MAYKTPIVCKELYLPCSVLDGNMTLDEYKAKYGIDLKPFIRLEDDGTIYFDFPHLTKCYICDLDYGSSDLPDVGEVNYNNGQQWDEGADDGELMIGHYDLNQNNGYSIKFSISRNAEFSIENIVVSEQGI